MCAVVFDGVPRCTAGSVLSNRGALSISQSSLDGRSMACWQSCASPTRPVLISVPYQPSLDIGSAG